MSKPTFKVNHVQVDEVKVDGYDTINELISLAITDAIANRDKQLEYYLRNFSEPKIKGEITKGKLRWRGIYMVQSADDNGVAIFQRGQQISPFITI